MNNIKLSVNIESGNDAFQGEGMEANYEVARILKNLGTSIERGNFLEASDIPLSDNNGNTVGTYSCKVTHE